MNKCYYGCEKEAKFILKNGKVCCELSPNKCEAVKDKNSSGLKLAYAENRKKKFKSLQHLDGKREWRKGKTIWSDERVGKKYTKEQIFSDISPISNGQLKKIILVEKLIEYKCECGIESCWQGKNIALELDHKNGNNRDNRLENLRFLCPNCHSQTETFRGRNKNTGRKKVSDEQIKNLISQGLNIRQILLKLNLAPQGANYERVKKIMKGSFYN